MFYLDIGSWFRTANQGFLRLVYGVFIAIGAASNDILDLSRNITAKFVVLAHILSSQDVIFRSMFFLIFY